MAYSNYLQSNPFTITDIRQWKYFTDELKKFRSAEKALKESLTKWRTKPLEGLLAGQYDDDSDYWVRRIMEQFGFGPMGTTYDSEYPTIISTLKAVAEDTGYSIESIWNEVIGEPDRDKESLTNWRDKPSMRRRVEDKYQEAKRIFERIKEDYRKHITKNKIDSRYSNKVYVDRDLTQDEIEIAIRNIMSELIKDDPNLLSRMGGLMPWEGVLDERAKDLLNREWSEIQAAKGGDKRGGLSDLLTPEEDVDADVDVNLNIDRNDFPVYDPDPEHAKGVELSRLNPNKIIKDNVIYVSNPSLPFPPIQRKTPTPVTEVPARTREYSPSGLTQLAGAYNPSVVGTSHPWAAQMQGGGSVANPMSFLTASQMLSMASPTSKRRRLTKYSSPQAAAIKALYENTYPDLNAFVSEGGLENLPNVRRKNSMIQRIKQKLAAAKRYQAAKGGMVPQTSFANGGLVELYQDGGSTTTEDKIAALERRILEAKKGLVTGEAAYLKEQAARRYERSKEPNSLAFQQFVSRYSPPEKSFEERARKRKEDINKAGEGFSGLVRLLINRWRTDEWDADIGRGIFDTETRDWFEDNWDGEEPLNSMIHIIEDWLQSDKGEQLAEVDKDIASNAAMHLAFDEYLNNAKEDINRGIDNREALALSRIELAGMEEQLAELESLQNKMADASDKNLPINWKLIAAGLAATTGGGGETFGETGIRMMQAYHGEEAAQAGARQSEADVIAKLAQARGFDAASMSPLFTLMAAIEKSKSATQEKELDRGLKSNIARLEALTEPGSPLASPEEISLRGGQAQDLLRYMGQLYTPNQPPLRDQSLRDKLGQIRNPHYTVTRKQ